MSNVSDLRIPYASILCALPEAVLVLDEADEICFANTAASSLLGWTAEMLVGQNLPSLALPQETNLLCQLRSTETICVSGQLQRGDGSRCRVEITATVLPEASENLLVLTLRPRTARTQKTVRRIEERFRLLVQNSSDMITLMDRQARIQYASPAVERTLGYSRSELTMIDSFSLVHPEDLPLVLIRFQSLLSQPGLNSTPFGLRVRHKDGSWRYVEAISDNQLHNPNASGIITNWRDITDRILREQQLDNLVLHATIKGQEEERERICLDLHDGICQHLSAAAQFLESMRNRPSLPVPLPERLATTQELVQEALRDARELIASLRPAMLDTLGLVATLQQQFPNLSARTGVQISISADEIRLGKDYDIALYRIINEAVNNAVKYAQATHIVVTLRLQEHLVVSIQDNGRGFDPTALPAPSATGGIGLLSMRKRAELLYGQFALESEPGKGAQVRVIIPLADTAQVTTKNRDGFEIYSMKSTPTGVLSTQSIAGATT